MRTPEVQKLIDDTWREAIEKYQRREEEKRLHDEAMLDPAVREQMQQEFIANFAAEMDQRHQEQQLFVENEARRRADKLQCEAIAKAREQHLRSLINSNVKVEISEGQHLLDRVLAEPDKPKLPEPEFRDLVVPEEQLFLLDAEGLKALELAQFEQAQKDAALVNSRGAWYVMTWNQQRRAIDTLRRFLETHAYSNDYSVNVDGPRMAAWHREHNEPIDRGSLIEAFRAIRAQDASVVVPVPPRIDRQPADTAITAGEPAQFEVTAAGTPPLEFQWFKDGERILGATKALYVTAATEFNNGSRFTVKILNEVGSVTSNPATLRTVMKNFSNNFQGSNLPKEKCDE